MEYQEEKLTDALVLARTRASDLESVKKLNFWGSDIENVSVVRRMPNLEVCSLSVNSITTLEDFSYCPNLQELYIRKNKIKDLSEINHLATLPRLRNLWLADNPCADTENYRSIVLKTLPTLQKLDNIVVTESEKAEFADTKLLTNDTRDPEVTGLVSTGEEATGLEATGREATGKEATGLEATGREATGEEATGLEATGREATGEEATGLEATGREATGEEATGLEATNTEAQGQDSLISLDDKEPESSHFSQNNVREDEKSSDESMTEVKVTEESSNVKDKDFKPHKSAVLDPVTLTWEETNKIRQEVGLKPLPFEKITSTRPVPASAMTSRNAHILQAVMILIRELDDDSLETVQYTIQRKLHPPS
ncbi:cilia- and flagella-associated protein 410-like [Ylistrum balloti]|uniref:cilia- and flagella-associated protein 410-like n=1 Tax=Ylistrum balloti TaxID=509963 RepID=UPI002905C16D|nr:cilia- and flagella-associated protein 410-like [Ylistrum balloti]